MESHAHAKTDTGHLEQVAPHITGEDRVTVANDGVVEPMEANNAVKEGPGDRRGSVQMAQGDEMLVLGEAMNDGEDDCLPWTLGRPSMKSIEMSTHTWDGTSRGCRRPAGCKVFVLLR
jgi:hypothetical protein